MSNQYLNDLIGTQIGEYTIQELVGEGTFSLVFRAVDKLGRNTRAIKIPRSFTAAPPRSDDSVPTQVFIKRQDRYSPQEASPIHIQKIQVARTRTVKDRGLVSVTDYSFDEASKSYIAMPLITGTAFRQYMQGGPVSIDLLHNLALTLDRLSQNDEFGYHGDVKPENMIVTEEGVVLVDCGYFGSIEPESTPDNDKKTLIVTTPRYYPHLIADDLLAFGLLLWESACRKPLLGKVSYSKDHDISKVGDELLSVVYEEEALGNFHFSRIVKAKRPSEYRPGMPEVMEEVLLKSVRLCFDREGVLDFDEGYESFEEIAYDLSSLIEQGIYYL
ncbi:MAG: hypothetical protein H6677_22885 [Candidatus Obscuribacterales bacterium]|nr:hypothetical protein [Candidatus Obscuribacterales bacterium]